MPQRNTTCILLRHFVCAQQVERGDTSIYIVFFNTTKLKEICPFYPLSFCHLPFALPFPVPLFAAAYIVPVDCLLLLGTVRRWVSAQFVGLALTKMWSRFHLLSSRACICCVIVVCPTYDITSQMKLEHHTLHPFLPSLRSLAWFLLGRRSSNNSNSKNN